VRKIRPSVSKRLRLISTLHLLKPMNYLAHSFLSFSNEPILFGQFIADDIKGNKWQQYEANIQQGILLHRFIDDFTDSHAQVLELKKLLHPRLGKFSGVVLDVLFDHVLSLKWKTYAEPSRERWIQETYLQLGLRRPEMSEKRKFIIDKMIEHDWMNMYLTQQGTSEILNQMGRRIPFGNSLEDSFEVFVLYQKDIISTFDDFFPQIISSTQVKLDTFAA